TGKIAYQTRVEIGDRDNAGTIHDKLMLVGAELMLKTVDAIIDGSITLQAQDSDSELLKPAPKIFKETCRIDWNLSAKDVDYFIRGLSPYPAAHTTLERGETTFNIKVFDAQPITEKHNYSVGTIVQPHPRQIDIAVVDGFIRILELQVQGRKRMKTTDFLNGFSIEENDCFK
ncbi:MAG: methionyl-tRNA formyltransferase, partial [Bacteroidales bacterium]|nr:methionyl-tRNA formyltransferase [Bacteroidales bacterium]